MSQESEYSPLPDSVQERISAAWSAYRNLFDLEGDILWNLIQNGASSQEINNALQQHREERAKLLPLWKNEWISTKQS